MTKYVYIFSFLLLVLFVYYMKRRWVKKNIYMKDEGLKKLLYNDFNSRAESNPDIEKTYTENGAEYIKGSGERNMSKTFVKALDDVATDLYNKTGIKIWRRITSGYRTPARNEDIGGVEGSAHTKGLAADISIWNMDESEVDMMLQLLEKHGIHRVGKYYSQNYFHVDMDYSEEITHWTG